MTLSYRVGDHVRVIDLDSAGVVAEVIGNQALVVVDLHGQEGRLTVRPANLEHLDLQRASKCRHQHMIVTEPVEPPALCRVAENDVEK